MNSNDFVVLNETIKQFGREWERIESYEKDEDDWELLFINDEWGSYDIYENNAWGGLIMFTGDDKIFVSYI